MGNFPLLEGIKKASDCDPNDLVRVITPERFAEIKARVKTMIDEKTAASSSAVTEKTELETIKTDLDALA